MSEASGNYLNRADLPQREQILMPPKGNVPSSNQFMTATDPFTYLLERLVEQFAQQAERLLDEKFSQLDRWQDLTSRANKEIEAAINENTDNLDELINKIDQVTATESVSVLVQAAVLVIRAYTDLARLEAGYSPIYEDANKLSNGTFKGSLRDWLTETVQHLNIRLQPFLPQPTEPVTQSDEAETNQAESASTVPQDVDIYSETERQINDLMNQSTKLQPAITVPDSKPEDSQHPDFHGKVADNTDNYDLWSDLGGTE